MRQAVTWFLRIYVPCVLLFVYAPVGSLALMSFHEGRIQSFPVERFSAKWFVEAWTNPEFRDGVATSLKVGFAVMMISTILGFISAHVLCRIHPQRMLLYVAFVCIPCLLPLLLSGMALFMYYQRIRLAGTIWAIILAHSCYCAPFAMGLIRNSYDALNEEVEQAAVNLGVGRWGLLWRVVLPQMRPAIVGAAAISFLLSWDEFIIAWFVGGFTKTLPTVIFSSLGTSFDPSINAIGMIATCVSAFLLFGVFAIMVLFDRRKRRI